MPKEVPVKEVINLSKQGYTDADIIRYLREQGYSPSQINDAMNRARIKMELEKTAGFEGEGVEGEIARSGEYGYIPKPSGGDMTPSILSREAPEAREEAGALAEEYGYYAPVPAEVPAEEVPSEAETQGESPPKYVPQYAPAEAAAPVEAAEGYPYAYPSYEVPAAAPAESMEELAEEIINEKWREFVEQVGDMNEFKRYIESRMKSVEERISRLESSFDRLHTAIMARVEDYGRGIKALGSELQALEGAFGKIVEPLTSSVKELRELSEEMKIKAPKTRALAEKLEKPKTKEKDEDTKKGKK